jgi:hypothetical protein
MFWFILSVVVGVFAGTKNRSGFGWFILSLFISPIITLILLAILPRRGSAPESCPLSECITILGVHRHVTGRRGREKRVETLFIISAVEGERARFSLL